MSKFKTFLVFGPNGIGKGTNAKAVGTLPGYLHFSTGDMFRALVARVKEGTASELEMGIDRMMKSGSLVDDQTTVRLARENLEQRVADREIQPGRGLPSSGRAAAQCRTGENDRAVHRGCRRAAHYRAP